MPVNIPTTSRPRVVIIGGGFGGLELAKRLKGLDVQIILIDKNNYHTFQPLLYQVATAALEPDSIIYSLRKIFKRRENVIFRMAEVLRIKPELKRIETSIGEIFYDYLVIAVGTKTNFFGMRDVERNAMRMKSVPQAMELRNLILESFEKALLTNDVQEHERLMTFTVVGGGPTGVETAGALGELKKIVLPKDYPELDFRRMQIHVVEMNGRLLGTMSESASQSAKRFLENFEINIWLKTKVVSYDGNVVSLSNGKKLFTSNVIWTAGVTGAVIPGLKPEALLPGNRLKVDAYNRVEFHSNIFAIGDIAAIITEKTPKGHPMLAPVAIQQARLLSQNLRRLMSNQPLKPFRYRDLGMMATVGRNHAVVDFHWIKFHGILGWFIWVFVHLMVLVGFRNRVVALVNWAWNYFSYDRGLRLIIRPFKDEKFS
ncbi:MAG: NAD(P)/FAD-dependent oxidoreductase [Candidatus Omnitrophica bacterium]|nr:NAD(P)/FAD-dependent oxidoreductase [Candidatus Omnitrophota bacterium]